MKCIHFLLILLPLQHRAQTDPGMTTIPWTAIANKTVNLPYPGSSAAPSGLSFQHNRSFLFRAENRYGMKEFNVMEVALQFHSYGGEWLFNGMVQGNHRMNQFQGMISHALKLNEQIGIGISMGYQGNHMEGFETRGGLVAHAGLLYFPKPEIGISMHYGTRMNRPIIQQGISFQFNKNMSAGIEVTKISGLNPALSALLQWQVAPPWTITGGFEGMGKQFSLGIGKTLSNSWYGLMLSQHPLLGFSSNLVYAKTF